MSTASTSGTGPKYIGKHVQPKEGMRVAMGPEFQNKGQGIITAIASGKGKRNRVPVLLFVDVDTALR